MLKRVHLLPLLLLLVLPLLCVGAPLIKVNRIGYVLGAQKLAVVTSSSSSALSWQLKNAAGQIVSTGSSSPFLNGAVDPGSGERVHRIDFSSYDVSGTKYTLCVNSLSTCSVQFDIGRGTEELLSRLRYDSMAFFYHQRSGIAIEASLTDAWHSRPAGHLSISPNQGDLSQTCRSSSQCSYKIDVRGGWYDAGDQGKYLVNGGISLWMILNTYERTLYVKGTNSTAWADGQMRIPERANGVPDLLDEARWELEFFLRMQVPDGNSLAGMCHHKIGDDVWTAFPMKPSNDPQPRVLAPPTTAATLNFAAVTAMAARIYSPYDSTFAQRCLAASKKAYAAAKQNPSLYAATTDQGSGTYDDSTVSDEFYWAATELFITTGTQQYLDEARAVQIPGISGTVSAYPGNGMWRVMEWGWVAPLGDISLLTVPNKAPSSELDGIRTNLVQFVRKALQADPLGYPAFTTTLTSELVHFYWGSAGNAASFCVLAGLAYEITNEKLFANAVYLNLGYLHGVNPLGQVFVAGYGGYSSDAVTHNVHHRFWCNQADSSYPMAPAGAIAGGPNYMLQDPQAEATLKGCVQQNCYTDHYQSYSTNEVCINWQAQFVWAATWAADHANSWPVDACAVNNGGCGPVATTTCASDSAGKAVCTCKPGYTGNPPTVPCDAPVPTSTAPAPVVSTAPAPVVSTAPAPLVSTAPGPVTCPFTVTDVGSNGYWLAYNVAGAAAKSVVARTQPNSSTSIALSGPNNWGNNKSNVYTANVNDFKPPFYLLVTDAAGAHTYTVTVTQFKDGAAFSC